MLVKCGQIIINDASCKKSHSHGFLAVIRITSFCLNNGNGDYCHNIVAVLISCKVLSIWIEIELNYKFQMVTIKKKSLVVCCIVRHGVENVVTKEQIVYIQHFQKPYLEVEEKILNLKISPERDAVEGKEIGLAERTRHHGSPQNLHMKQMNRIPSRRKVPFKTVRRSLNPMPNTIKIGGQHQVERKVLQRVTENTKMAIKVVKQQSVHTTSI